MNWDNKPKSAGAFAGFLLGVYFLEPWMITLGLLIPFVKNIIVRILEKNVIFFYCVNCQNKIEIFLKIGDECDWWINCFCRG